MAARADGLVLQSTSSSYNAGLYDHLLPAFYEAHKIDVRVVVSGTGKAISNARRCDGDLLLVHAKEAEEAFVASGYGVKRFDVMYNHFVLIGPDEDPARVRSASTAQEAFDRIARAGVRFVSRGDDSGTHLMEKTIWQATPHKPFDTVPPWYLETGSGMGASLNVAVGIDGYILSDRATWLAFNNKRNLQVLFTDDPALLNQYGIVAVNPENCPRTKIDEAERFIQWILSDHGQKRIDNLTIDGQRLFIANAQDPKANH